MGLCGNTRRGGVVDNTSGVYLRHSPHGRYVLCSPARLIKDKTTFIDSVEETHFINVLNQHIQYEEDLRWPLHLFDMSNAYWRRKAATQLAKDKAKWFGADWEAKQDAADDKSNQACREDEFEEILQELEDANFRIKGHTLYPGGGYMADNSTEQALFRKQLEAVSIDWNKPSTRRRLDIGPKNEMALEHEGFTPSEVAARFRGESVEFGGEFDGEQTIVVAKTSIRPGSSTVKQVQQQRVVVDEDGDVEMDGVESSDEDGAEYDPDFKPMNSARGKKRRL